MAGVSGFCTVSATDVSRADCGRKRKGEIEVLATHRRFPGAWDGGRLREGGECPKGPLVAVIDSGVHAGHPHVPTVRGGVGIDEFGKAHADFVDRLGHGTAVTAAILEKAPAADILTVRVFDHELSTTGRALVSALQWARSQGAQLVNLSLGTTNSDHEAALLEEVSVPGLERPHCLRRAAAWLSMAARGVARRYRRRHGHDHAAGLLRDRDWDRGRDHRTRVRLPATNSGCAPGEEPQGLELCGRNVSGILARAWSVRGAFPDWCEPAR